MSHPDPRPPAADGERALPEEIASAIEALVNAIGYAASDDGVFLEDMNCDEARSTLTTSILSRLTAAEAGREEAEKELTTLRRVHRWNVEHSDGEVLVCRNNHDKGDDCDWERFVPEERLAATGAERDEALRISAEALELVRKHAIEALAAETARDAALARLTAAEADAEDAARFRALMRCGRIKPQGSAGVDCLTGGRTYPDHPGMVHFGAEFWVQPEAALSPFTVWGRHCLRALADDILAYEAAALTEAGRHALKDA